MSLALYRKYRPRTFAEVIGQGHVTDPLMQAIRTGRLHHAYLFSGPRGCGKTSSARILARSLNCVKGPTPEPCGECDSCVALAPDGGSLDVVEIDAASHGGVDAPATCRARLLRRSAGSGLHRRGPHGVDAGLQCGSSRAQYVKFVATTEPEKVLGTIGPARITTRSGWCRRACSGRTWKLCHSEGVGRAGRVPADRAHRRHRSGLAVGVGQLIAGAGVHG